MFSTVKHRFDFFMLKQEREEKTSNFFERLKKLANLCDFVDKDERIFDKIVAETRLEKLRNIAFANSLTLESLVSLGEILEHELPEGCTRCGEKDHNFLSDACLAKSIKCGRCGIIGHFPDFCMNMKFTETNSEGDQGEKRYDDSSSSSLQSFQSKAESFSCIIGNVRAQLIISDEFRVNVVTLKFWLSHRFLFKFFCNKAATLTTATKRNGIEVLGKLETLVDHLGHHVLVDFFIAAESDEKFCIITSRTARKLGLEL